MDENAKMHGTIPLEYKLCKKDNKPTISSSNGIRNQFYKKYIDKLQSAKIAGGILAKKAITGPWTVQIDIINNCNNDCVGCWCHSPLLGELAMSPEIKKKYLETNLVMKLIDDLYKLGARDMYFTGGGEPFMHPDSVKIMEYVKSKGMRCDMSTNFTLMTEEKAMRLVDAGVDNMNCSIWAGSSEGYERTHPNKSASTFEQLRKKLFFMSHYKKKKMTAMPNIQIYNVISTLNYDDFENMIEFAFQVKANGIDFTPTDIVPGKTDTLMLDEKQRLWLLDKIRKIPKKIQYWEKYYRHRLTNMKLGSLARRMESDETEKGKYDKNIIGTFPCYAGFTFLRILADGSVNSCLKSQNIEIGNIYHNSIKTIWNSAKQEEFRNHTINYRVDNPYFNQIGNRYQSGNGCLLCCDNIEFNHLVHKKIRKLGPLLRTALYQYAVAEARK
ncbi:MAG: radical SAM protein [archaeon]